MSRPAAGGGRWVEVAPERLERWLAGFAERHGGLQAVKPEPADPEDTDAERTDPVPDAVVARAADGSTVDVHLPFPARVRPMSLADVVAEARRPRRVGLVLVRRGGHAVAVLDGPRVVDAKVGSRHVQGRTAAGGWSQRRYARRREGQARVAAAAAADTVAALLLPELSGLEAVATGGDRPMLGAVLADSRLAALRPLVVERVLDVAEPRRAVLEQAVAQARAVRVRIVDPLEGAGPPQPPGAAASQAGTRSADSGGAKR